MDDGLLSIQIFGREDYPPEKLVFECQDGNGREVKFHHAPPEPSTGRR